MAQQRTQWIDLDPLELVNDAVDADWFPFLQKSMLGPPADGFRDLLNRKIDLATRHFKFESLPEFAGFLAYLKAASNYDGMYKALYINAEIARDAKWMQYVEKGRQASAIGEYHPLSSSLLPRPPPSYPSPPCMIRCHR